MDVAKQRQSSAMWEKQAFLLPSQGNASCSQAGEAGKQKGMLEKAGDAMGHNPHTPRSSERQGLKTPRRFFSKRELCIQAGSIFLGKFLKQTSLRKILYFSKQKKENTKRYCKSLTGDLGFQRLCGHHL